LTAAVQSGVGEDDVNKDTSTDPTDADDGWQKEGDDDAFFDDDDDENNASATKGKTNDAPPKVDGAIPVTETLTPTVASKEKPKPDESTSSFVEVSPNSSISTPEALSRVTPKDGQKESSSTAAVAIEDDPRFVELRERLRLREEQLVAKGSQLNELQLLLETRDDEYKKKLQDTKDEAKKRILRAKERCEVAETKLKARSSGDSDDLRKKQLIIDELMEEGQALAHKQSAMEKSVRASRSESRALTEELYREAQAKEDALNKVADLEGQCKDLKESLASARKGESQAEKLESDLLSARADAEEKAGIILSLQQKLKEQVAETKELNREINDTRKSAAHEAQQEKTSMRREHNDVIGDLEKKLRTTEREAGVREDALRHEISEVRKRWQDAIRRADALSTDIQSSTAPLLRQLESMERQNRLRASNTAELETRLRSELEEATIQNETLGKDCAEFRSRLSKLERSIKERDNEITLAKKTITEQETDIEDRKNREEKLTSEVETRRIEYERVEKLANEGVARVRSEMSQTVTDSEERYRGQIDQMRAELNVEQEKRSQLEEQVGRLLESGGLFGGPPSSTGGPPTSTGMMRESKPKKLHRAEGQAEILAGALGLGNDSDESDSDDDDGVFDTTAGSEGGFNSFAALEQLSSKLKTAEVELGSMRKSLKESNESRQSLVEELGEARIAKEKLPLFEEKVKELTRENREMELEIAGLREDITDVRDMYRTQLNVLLEEKASALSLPQADEAPPPDE